MTATPTHPDPADSPVAWFVALEDARRRGDRSAERRAREALRRLGVTIRYSRSRYGGEGVANG